jgi:hypothetical protein
MGEVVRERKALGPSVDDLEFLSDVYHSSASLLIARRLPVLADTLTGTDAEPVDVRLADDEYDQVGKAQQTDVLIERAKKLEDITYLDNSNMWRLRIEPIQSGVVRLAITGGAGGSDTKKSRFLEAGEVIEGKSGVIGAISSSPSLGGEIVFDHLGRERPLPLRRGVHITGLVSPETGEEQASLEILAKQ